MKTYFKIMALALCLTACGTTVKPSVKPVALPVGAFVDEQGCFVMNDNVGEVEPLLKRLVFEHYTPMNGMKETEILAAISAAKSRSCDMNQRDDAGFAPLHTAILLHDIKMMAFLLQNGASPRAKIVADTRKQGSEEFHQQDSFQLVETLKRYEKRDNRGKLRNDWQKIEQLLRQYDK
ncbi:MAG: ankyrin repeat domain-containing protein [Neisseria sp.]|nr:ankyrin repeat domain-containing protein [Neisseria sp.]